MAKFSIVEAEVCTTKDGNISAFSIHTHFADTRSEANEILVDGIREAVEGEYPAEKSEEPEMYDKINREVGEILSGGWDGKYCYKAGSRTVKWQIDEIL